MELMVMPFPNPLTTPPVTAMYFMGGEVDDLLLLSLTVIFPVRLSRGHEEKEERGMNGPFFIS